MKTAIGIGAMAMLVGLACTVEAGPAPAAAKPRTAPAQGPAEAVGRVIAEPDVQAQLRDAARPEALAADAGPVPGAPARQVAQATGLTVLAAGDAPRQVLARTPEVGDRQRVTMTLGMKMAMHLGHQAVPPATVPALAVDVDVKVDRIADDGVHYAFEVVDVRVGDVQEASERLRKAVLEAGVALSKLAGTGRLGTDGAGPRFVVPEDAQEGLAPTLDGFRDSFAQLLVALPTEPVGVGARWQVVGDTVVSGLPVQRTTTYSVRAIADGVATLDVAFTEAGVTGPTTASGSIHANGHVAKGSGDVQVDLGAVLPASGHLVANATTHATVSLGAEPQDVVTTLGVDARVTARAPAPSAD